MENALYNAYTPVIHRYMKRYDGTTHFKVSTNMAPSNKLLGWQTVLLKIESASMLQYYMKFITYSKKTA